MSNADIKTYAAGVHSLMFTPQHVNNSDVAFMAFLTSFTQNFASTWNSESVYGRIDPIGTFQGNKRTLSLGWDVPSGTLKEAKANMKNIETLMQIIYPSYTGGDGGIGSALTLSKPPLMRLLYANLICTPDGDGLLGWIDSISWTPSLDMGLFEEGQEILRNIYPKVISLQINFSVLHEGEMGYKDGVWKGGATFPFGG
jgi:hypothetical protein